GTMVADGHTTVTSRGSMNNSGTVSGGQGLTLSASSIDNSGTLQSKGSTTISTPGYVNNTAGSKIISTGFLTLNSGDWLTNYGTLYSADGAALSSTNALFNGGAIQSGLGLSLAASHITNSGAIYGGGNTQLLSRSAMVNTGTLGADGDLTLTMPGEFSSSNTLHARGHVWLNAGGNVTNTATLAADRGLTLTTQGNLFNSGTLYGKEAMRLTVNGSVTNGGTLGSGGELTLTTGGSLLNNGTLYSQGAGKYRINGSFTNHGLLRSEDQIWMDTQGYILNEADVFSLLGLNLSSEQSVTNHAQLYSGGELRLRARGNLTNSATLAALGNMIVSANAFSQTGNGLLAAGVQSNGQLAQNGNLTLNVAQSADLQGQTLVSGILSVDANGINLADARVSAGAITFQAHGGGVNTDRAQAYVSNALNADTTAHWSNLGGKLYAGEINLNAASLTNDAQGEISAQSNKITLSTTLSNRGLIDGLLTRLQARQIDNYGTGRIYGTWLGLQANTINNREEGGIAATIAGRESVDIGAGILNNYAHSLIFSGGNMSIGRWLDDNGNATGMGDALNNHSATVEALGNLQLSTRVINNINDHFLTEVRQISQEHILQYRIGGGQKFYTPDEIYIDYNREVPHLISDEYPRGTDNYYLYDYIRTIEETVITETDPAKILSGGNLIITANSVLNDKSQIVAGNVLSIDAAELSNIEVLGQRIISDVGNEREYYRHSVSSGRDRQRSRDVSYTPAPVVQDITLRPSETQGNTQPNGSGTSIAGRQEMGAPSGGIGAISIDRVNIQIGGGDVSVVTRPPSLNLALPNTSLYRINPAASSHYLVETDPKFANYKTWLSSDYMTSQIKSDPNNVFKRLGDGFYEQQLIREQIISLTGQRYLGSYADDDEQFKALMNNGVAFAEKYSLSLGIALTPEQMANLTSDIVWMVSREVTLADGSKQTVLVPQVYAMVKPQDIDSNGALLAGKQVGLQLTGDMVNQGRILAGDKLSVLAQNIQNMGGTISSANVALAARNDINNIGGLMQGGDSLRLKAGHDINITTTTNQAENGTSNNRSSHTNINQMGALLVNNDNGTLQLSAGNDINLTATVISNQGQNGHTLLEAGHDLNMKTVTVDNSRHAEFNKDNYYTLSHSQDIGTQINGNGNITLAAKNDINARAAQVTTDSQLAVIAGRDINITAGQSTDYIDTHRKTSYSGTLTKTTKEEHSTSDTTSAQSSYFSGDNVVMKAGHDLLVQGSQVAATHDVTLKADNNLTITGAQETSNQLHMERETKSGLMSSGGIGATYGKIDEKSTQTVRTISNLGSTVGSTEGSVILIAGNDLAIKGSDVIAKKDISLTGKNVSVESVENQTSIKDVYERTQTGMTVALSGAVGSALNAAVTQAKQAQDANDSKIEALQQIKAALS
ncbi:beta strand repeat-containing protein, partial [Budvicia diplopodorum]|uniref:beta strand repeat-containing protein n=1 Tax=Budvicia diplopodorum TaxID=1119056 RepID=UPI001BA84B54